MSDVSEMCRCGHRRGMHSALVSVCCDVRDGNPHDPCPCERFTPAPVAADPRDAALRGLVEALAAVRRDFDAAGWTRQRLALEGLTDAAVRAAESAMGGR